MTDENSQTNNADLNTENSSGIDVDSILERVYTESNHEIPMEAPPKEDAAPTPQTPQEFEFTWNGKQIKAPMDKLTQWAQQGYDYSQKISEHKKAQEEFANKQKGFDTQYKTYQEIDTFAKQNPDWWLAVQKQWEARQTTSPNAADPSTDKLSQLMNQVQELSQFKESILTERQQAEIAKADDALDQEIQGVQKSYKDVDFAAKDQTGSTLEYRVLEHAKKLGTNSFKAAFNDYYSQELIKRAEERGKETVSKELARRQKLGLLGESPTPRSRSTYSDYNKNQSYDDIYREVLSERGIK